jgi:hypothetical protein
MIYMLKPYLDIIMAERSWSWSLIGILYVLAAFFVRSWFMNSPVWKAKQLDKGVYSAVKAAYLRRSFAGWFFFFLPLGFFVLYWQKFLPFKLDDKWMAIAGAVSLVVAILLHLRAFALGAIAVLKKQTENLKEKNLYEG